MKSEISKLFEQKGGNLSLSDAKKERISASTLDRYVATQELIKEAPGFYVLPESMIDELYLAQSVYKRGVFSHDTALDLYQLSTNLPNGIHMTFPKGYNPNTQNVRKYDIYPHYTSKLYYPLGICKVSTFYGNEVLAYDKERTLCDMWNSWYKANSEVREQALRDYMASAERDTVKLRKYMNLLPVSKEMKMFLKALY
ncbi:type IV toxin-antitoxin system AbiEi family antitoxin domain-containing protein [Enterococcus faecalis]|uniref:type IV toxin-antitoxin system AbiEi family antitoxin domain-containing protein n=1 Tax=Enterococcus faecalis TaxID=1351 RepID=UPI00288F1BF7|nr:amino acid ABC transporter substrate-binding protein [Enterococcus faecalis]MDT2227887.1 amino acid ABC transporter substrate-binding protein [Enterococcus faecalis]